jgi:hypothetical protein
MPQSTAKTPKAPAARKPTAAEPKLPADKTVDLVDRTAGLSEEVLKSVEAGQRAALVAVRKFVDTVDEALPTHGDRPSRRETVIDAALDMADKLVTTQYDFLRSVVRSVDRSLTRPDAGKK